MIRNDYEGPKQRLPYAYYIIFKNIRLILHLGSLFVDILETNYLFLNALRCLKSKNYRRGLPNL